MARIPDCCAPKHYVVPTLDEHYHIDWLELHTEKICTSCVSPAMCVTTLCVATYMMPGPSPLYLAPCAITMRCFDEDTRDRCFVRITSVIIDGISQEAVHTPSPTLATTQYIDSSLWDPIEIGRCRPKLEGDRARPIRWGLIGSQAVMKECYIVFVNPHLRTVRTEVKVYGVPYDQPRV